MAARAVTLALAAAAGPVDGPGRMAGKRAAVGEGRAVEAAKAPVVQAVGMAAATVEGPVEATAQAAWASGAVVAAVKADGPVVETGPAARARVTLVAKALWAVGTEAELLEVAVVV